MWYSICCCCRCYRCWLALILKSADGLPACLSALCLLVRLYWRGDRTLVCISACNFSHYVCRCTFRSDNDNQTSLFRTKFNCYQLNMLINQRLQTVAAMMWMMSIVQMAIVSPNIYLYSECHYHIIYDQRLVFIWLQSIG